MTNSIESIINLLTNDKATADQLLNLTSALSQKKDDCSQTSPEQTNNNGDRFKLKINLINAIMPFLSEKAREQAQFLIKLLTVISIINQMKSTDN